MAENRRSDYSQMVRDTLFDYKVSHAYDTVLSNEICTLQILRDKERGTELELHRKLVLLENLDRAYASREGIHREMIGSPLIREVVNRSLDVLSNPAITDPLCLAESLTDSVSSISIPSEDDQLSTKVILAEEESSKSNLAIVRVGISSTCVVFINGFSPDDVEDQAVVLNIKDGGESGVTISGLNTTYLQSPANDGRIRFLQKPSTKPPEFLEMHTDKTESRLENFFGTKNYQALLGLMRAK